MTGKTDEGVISQRTATCKIESQPSEMHCVCTPSEQNNIVNSTQRHPFRTFMIVINAYVRRMPGTHSISSEARYVLMSYQSTGLIGSILNEKHPGERNRGAAPWTIIEYEVRHNAVLT